MMETLAPIEEFKGAEPTNPMTRHLPRVALVLCSLAAFGCGTPPSTQAEPKAAPVASPPSHLITFSLRDAALVDVLQAVAASAGKAVVIAPDAQPIARCARVTLFTPEPLPIDQVERLLAEAVSSASLELKSSEDGWMIRRGEGPEPTDCAASTPAQPTAGIPRDGGEERADVQQLTQGIRSVGENRYEVQRSTLDGLLENQAGLMRQARIVPAMRDGQVHGIRLFGVRSASVLSALGFQNGDTILRVAGLPVDSPDKALEAYAKIRNADVIEVDIERRGHAITMTYRMVAQADGAH
jgi:hypothetical protein